jgi:hypothetical protein
MHEDWSHLVEGWHEFFLLIGTAGLTLTGLLFVVVSLGPRVVAGSPETGLRAFITPNVFYFSTTLIVSAVLLIPPLSPLLIGTFLCVGSLGSLGYLVYAGTHQQWRTSKLPAVDWVFYACLPTLAFVLLLVSGVGFFLGWSLSMHGVGLALILLLFAGIRNAWDLVIWMIQHEPKSTGTNDKKDSEQDR